MKAIAVLTVVSASICAQAWAGVDFGFSRTETTDGYGRVVVTNRDAESGLAVETTYGPAGLPDEIVERAAADAVVERRSRSGDVYVHEVFRPEHVRTTQRPSLERPGFLELEVTVFEQGRPSTTVYELAERAANSCGVIPPPTDVKSAMAVLNGINGLKFSVKSSNDSFDYLDNNVVAAKSCATGVPSYPSGAKQLAHDVQTSLRVGLQCLKDLGRSNARYTGDALRLAGLLDKQSKPLRLFCGKDGDKTAKYKNGGFETVGDERARALDNPNLVDLPAIQLNTASTLAAEKPRQRASDIFHELMHLLGYKHSDTQPDVAYLAQYCCFADKDAAPMNSMNAGKLKADSCALLRNVDKIGGAGSAEYAAQFMKVMSNGLAEPIALSAAINAARRAKKPNGPIGGDIFIRSAAALSTSSVGALPESKLVAAIYFNAGKRNLGDELGQKMQKVYERDYVDTYSEDKKKAVDALARALSSELNGDAAAARTALADLKALGPQICLQFDTAEKKALADDLHGHGMALDIGGVFQDPYLENFCPPHVKK